MQPPSGRTMFVAGVVYVLVVFGALVAATNQAKGRTPMQQLMQQAEFANRRFALDASLRVDNEVVVKILRDRMSFQHCALVVYQEDQIVGVLSWHCGGGAEIVDDRLRR